MGYGSFILIILREFRRLFYNKKIKRAFTIIILVFAIYLFLSFIGLLPDKVAFAAEEITSSYYYDGVQATYKDYEAIQNDFVTRVLAHVRANNGTITNTSLINTLNRMSNGGFAVFFYYGDALGSYYQNTSPSASQKNIIEIIQMDASQVTSTTNNYNWGLNGVQGVRGYLCATSYYELKFNRASISSVNLAANTARHWLPSYLVDYKSTSLISLIELWATGQLNSTTASDLLNAIENQTSKIEEQTQVLEETQNTIKDSSVDNTIVDTLPEDNIEDITESDLNSIFSDIMDALVNPIVENINIKVPFTNKYLTISSDSVYGENNSLIPTWIKTIVQVFWYYILGLYIIKDISKIINNLKNGRFEAIESGNIKEDML